LAELFRDFNTQLKNQRLIAEVLNFVDVSQIVYKAITWNERDKAIKKVVRLSITRLQRLVSNISHSFLIMVLTYSLYPQFLT